MTAQDAFAIAFDEAIVMDAMPGNDMPKNSLPQKPSASSGLKKNAAAMPGADASDRGKKSLSQHLQEGCEAQKNGHPERCPYVKSMAKEISKSQGIDYDSAIQKAIGIHSEEAMKVQRGTSSQEAPKPKSSEGAIPPEKAVEKMVENPTSIATTPSDVLEKPEVISTSEGEIPVQSTVQKAIVESLEDATASDNPQVSEAATEALSELKSNVDDGIIVESQGSGQAETSTAAANQEHIEPPTMQFTSADGSLTMSPDRQQQAIIDKDPSKKELFQKMVDNIAEFQNTKDPKEQERINTSLDVLKRMFYRADKLEDTKADKNTEESPSDKKDITKEEIVELVKSQVPGQEYSDDGWSFEQLDDGEILVKHSNGLKAKIKGNLVDKKTTSESIELPKEGDGGNVPPKEPPKTTEAQKETSAPESPKEKYEKPVAPSDEEFRVGKNKYKVGGLTYTDVSGMGSLRSMLASFMAGLRGEAIITGWDRITGAWDGIKRSAKGEMVRDGISSALMKNTISDYAKKEGLSDEAKMEISVIQDIIGNAKSPAEQMKALQQFKKWKDTYAEELDKLDKPKSGEIFKPLPSGYKGKKPPLSILKKPQGFKSDKEFGEKTAAAIEKRLGLLGLNVESLDSVKVGPSATTIQFKVPPTFDLSAAKSAKTRASLKGATGTDISNVEYAKGKQDVLSITVTNPEMRTVGFSDIMNSKEWKEFSSNAAIPIALGRDSSGDESYFDAATMPQTIVTGATGSGKSVFLSSAINSVEMTKTPDQVRIVLLDPKNEFKVQDGSPHLLFPRAGGDPDKMKASQDIADVLESLVAIMNDRVTKIGGVVEGFDPNKNEFKGAAEHSIKQYNASHPDDQMPHIFLVFDEIANARDNASAADKKRIDLALQKITAIGRSVGINSLLASQRDDVGSIPGIIQANCPGRVTFKASPTDAKATQEAKSLAGNGDYILTDKGGNKKRGRGCFISAKEELAVPSYYRDHMEGSPDELDESPIEEGGEIESAAPETSEPPKEEEKESETNPKSKTQNVKAKDKGLDLTSRESMLNSANAIYNEAIEDAKEQYSKDKDLDKFNEARTNAKEAYNKAVYIANDMFPNEQNADEILDGENIAEENPATSNSSQNESNDDEELANLFNNPQELLSDAKENLKRIAEEGKKKVKSGKMTNREAKKEFEAALKRYNAALAKQKAGGTYDEVLAELEPEDNVAGEESKTTPQNENEAIKPPEVKNSNESQEGGEWQGSEAEKDAKLLKTVPPPKFYSGGSATHSDIAVKMLTPKEQKQLKETLVPPGWDFVTSNNFGSPAQTSSGKVFVQHPTNGSWGYIFKDSKTGERRLHIDTNTTHPEYKGLIKDKQGQWIEPDEVKEAKSAWKHEAKYGNPKKAQELKEKFYHMRYGRDPLVLDEAPDNMTIVANAVADALQLI